MRKDHIRNISREQLDAAGAALTNPENEDKLREALKQAEFEPLEIEALLTLPSFAGYGHISVKACRKLIPYLEQGMNYNDACQAAGYDFQGRQNGEKAQFLPASTEEMEGILQARWCAAQWHRRSRSSMRSSASRAKARSVSIWSWQER